MILYVKSYFSLIIFDIDVRLDAILYFQGRIWYIGLNMRKEKIFVDLGNTIREAREKAGLKQSEVAKTANLNVTYYAQIERGEVNPSYEKLQAIMKVLKIKSLDIS